MHRQKKAPWVFHDFWLRDMDFANGEKAALAGVPGKALIDAHGQGASEKTPAGVPGKARDGVLENARQTAGGTCEFAFFPAASWGQAILGS
jgi:hypothetical protein